MGSEEVRGEVRWGEDTGDDVDDAYVEGSEEVAVIRGFVFDVAAYVREQTVSAGDEGREHFDAIAGAGDDGSIVDWRDVEPRVYTAEERATIEKEVSVSSKASRSITKLLRPCYFPYIHPCIHIHAITNGNT
jgi:hypothetical protein